MARFDWLGFFRQHNIEYVTSGPNTGRNAASIKCPFCGDADPSQHLGVSLVGKGWGCLRNAGHRGKAPAWLIQKLLGCSLEEARRITGSAEVAAPTRDDFAASFAALKASVGVVEAPRPTRLELPPEFKPLINGSPFAEPFLAYLRERGYGAVQIRWLAENYRLHYATRGSDRYRIIVPIYDRFGGLVSWTGRTIKQGLQPRYRTLRVESDEPGEPAALMPSNHTILGLPVLWGAANPRVLLLVEGPFDALKVSAFGHVLGVYAAALFGLNIYPSQVAEVLDLSSRFDKVYLLLDADAELQRLRLFDQLIGVRCQVLRMPPGSDDPGALSGSEIVKMVLPLITAK